MFKQAFKMRFFLLKLKKTGSLLSIWVVYLSWLEAQANPTLHLKQATHLTSHCFAV